MTRRMVIKIGSLGVTHEQGGISTLKIENLCKEIAKLWEAGIRPILVSSGAVNCGKNFIGKTEDKKTMISSQQAAAAIGQPLLMEAYLQAFKKYNITCSQILVTHEDFKIRERFLNIRNTFNELLKNKILPIVNENDTVSFSEITVGDNDQLAVMVTEATDADKLIFLTLADGLYDQDPKNPRARRFDVVEFADNLSGIKFSTKTSSGRGGMETKLKAIKKLTPNGIDVIIGSFEEESFLERLVNQKGGSLFKGNPTKQRSKRKAWLSLVVKNDAWVSVDEGCSFALLRANTSVLPVGVVKVYGKFKRGDIIGVKFKQKIIAVGISEFSSKELDLIKGVKSSFIPQIIKAAPSRVVIHKDNLLLKNQE